MLTALRQNARFASGTGSGANPRPSPLLAGLSQLRAIAREATDAEFDALSGMEIVGPFLDVTKIPSSPSSIFEV